jgi:methionyl aminopeptidase
MEGSDSDSSDEEMLDISTPEVLAKYRLAAEIANRTLKMLMEQCKVGMKILDLCELGDRTIVEECAKVHNKGKAKVEAKDKGVAFPTCISVNEIAGHNSPPLGDETTLADGDLVKIDLSVHIDGWIASVAHTLCVAEDPAAPIEGRKGAVVMAAAVAAEGLFAALKPGVSNASLPPIFENAAKAFGVNVVEGVLSHQTKRFVIDGNKVIISKVVPGEQTVDEDTFEVNDVLAVDIMMSTGEGKPQEKDEKKQMVFKRAVDQNYNLKMKVSREIFSKITSMHPTLPFTLRDYEDSRARLGMKECLEHDLFHTYPVLEEKEGEFVAQFKFTVMLSEEGVQRVTGGFLPNCTPDVECGDEELWGIYQKALEKAAKKKAKKSKKK